MRSLALFAPSLLLCACLTRPPGRDQDGDGYPIPDDCDDSEGAIHPGADEIWYDGVDGDCAGDDDYDQDHDGYPSDQHGGRDCDDLDKEVHPEAVEQWYDGEDQDCSGGSDYDKDGDGYDHEGHGGDDCHDGDPDINPGAVEIWYDGVDQDCNGSNDYDQDGDGYDHEGHGGDDCDDSDDFVHPDAYELMDGIDQDCDQLIDEVPWGGGPTAVDEFHQGLGGEPSTFDGLGTAVCPRPLDAVGMGNLGGSSLDPSQLVHDGYPDLLISAPLNGLLTSAVTADSAVYLVPGGSARDLELLDVAERTVLRLEPTDPDVFFGSSLAWLPSLDADSTPEIAVGATAWSDFGSRLGMAFVFTSEDWDWASITTTEGGSSIRRMDTDGATVTFMAETAGDGLGDVASLGDFDQSGGGDLALTAPYAGADGVTEPGVIAVFMAPALAVSPGTVLSLGDHDLSIRGNDDNEHVGLAQPVMAYLNGDGLADLVVSAPRTATGHGRVAAMLGGGSPTGDLAIDELDLQIIGSANSLELGSTLSAGGDLDGDGHDDLAMLAHSAAGEPVVVVIDGGKWVAEADTNVGITTLLRVDGATDSTLLSRLGIELGGDFNGDGRPDLVVASPAGETSTGGGHVSIFWGRTDLGGTVSVADAGSRIVGPGTSWLGYAAVLASDLDTDGFDELLLGAPGSDPATVPGIHRPGALFVLDPLQSW